MYNIKRLTFFGFADEEAGTYDSNAIYPITKRSMQMRDNRNFSSTPNYGDGEETDRYYGVGDRNVEVQIQDITAAEYSFLHGAEVANGVLLTSGDDYIPSVGMAALTERADGHVNLFKYFKCKFPPGEINVTQKTGNNVTFSNTTMSGSYRDLESIGKDRAICADVDPNTQAAFIERWFTEPAFYGQSTLANNSTFKVSSTDITEGQEIEEGTSVSLAAVASGGTSPYSYTFLYRKKSSSYWYAIAEDTTTASQSLTLPSVTADTEYEIAIIVKDAAGSTVKKTRGIVVKNGT